MLIYTHKEKMVNLWETATPPTMYTGLYRALLSRSVANSVLVKIFDHCNTEEQQHNDRYCLKAGLNISAYGTSRGKKEIIQQDFGPTATPPITYTGLYGALLSLSVLNNRLNKITNHFDMQEQHCNNRYGLKIGLNISSHGTLTPQHTIRTQNMQVDSAKRQHFSTQVTLSQAYEGVYTCTVRGILHN